MKRIVLFVYGVACYGVFFASLLYSIAFLGNFGLTKSIDSQPTTSTGTAIAIDVALLAVFAVQHSAMARTGFKRWITRIIPETIERSTYVLASSVALLLLFRYWEPIGGVIWSFDSDPGRTIMYALYGAGLLIVLLSTFMINHFDLFGLRQVYLQLTGTRYTQVPFRVPFFYRFVRHPLYVGWFFTFWSAPVMTSAHLLFAIMTTVYILIAIQLEERDLVALHGNTYEQYRREVPMLIPRLCRSETKSTQAGHATTAV